jgi:hypothetical protein
MFEALGSILSIEKKRKERKARGGGNNPQHWGG